MPVVGGTAVIGAILLATWGLAAYVSRGGAESSERLAPSSLPVGNVESVADEVAEEGPILFQDLDTARGERSLVLDHEGSDPTQGWRIYLAHPADRDASCTVEQVRGTSRFTDCDGRELEVTDLALPDADIRPVVEDRTALSIDLRGATADTGP